MKNCDSGGKMSAHAETSSTGNMIPNMGAVREHDQWLLQAPR